MMEPTPPTSFRAQYQCFQDRQYLHQLLMHLRTEFESLRGQLLYRDPLSWLEVAFVELEDEETHLCTLSYYRASPTTAYEIVLALHPALHLLASQAPRLHPLVRSGVFITNAWIISRKLVENYRRNMLVVIPFLSLTLLDMLPWPHLSCLLLTRLLLCLRILWPSQPRNFIRCNKSFSVSLVALVMFLLQPYEQLLALLSSHRSWTLGLIA